MSSSGPSSADVKKAAAELDKIHAARGQAVPSSDDINSFVSRADEVARQVKALADGKIDPEDVEAGITQTAEEMERERKEREEKRIAAERKLQDKLAEAAKKERQEESERWWRFAKFQFNDIGAPGAADLLREDLDWIVEAEKSARDSEEAEDSAHAAADGPSSESKHGGASSGAGAAVVEARTIGESAPIDYTKWDELAKRADGPIYKEDFEEIERLKEEAKDRQFEESNPEFVANFLSDQKKREETRKKRADDAERLKKQGTEAYKEGRLDHAMGCWLESVRLVPFQEQVLTNVAQLCIRMGKPEEALEFARRAIFIAPGNPKALFRRATARRVLKDVHGWAADMKRAAERAPKDLKLSSQAQQAAELSAQLRRAEILDHLVAGTSLGKTARSGSGSGSGSGVATGGGSGGLSPAVVELLRETSEAIHGLPGFVVGRGDEQPGDTTQDAATGATPSGSVAPSGGSSRSPARGSATAAAQLQKLVNCVLSASMQSQQSTGGAAPSASTEDSPRVLVRALLLRTGALTFIARGLVRLLESSAGQPGTASAQSREAVRELDLPGLALSSTGATKSAFNLLTASVSGTASSCRELLQNQGVLGACVLFLTHLSGLKSPSESCTAADIAARGIASGKSPAGPGVEGLVKKKDSVRWAVARHALRFLRTACGAESPEQDASAMLCLSEVLVGSQVLEASTASEKVAASKPRPSVFAPLEERVKGSGPSAGSAAASAASRKDSESEGGELGPRVRHGGLLAPAAARQLSKAAGRGKTAIAPQIGIAKVISAAAGAFGPGPIDIALMTRQMVQGTRGGVDKGSVDGSLGAEMQRHGQVVLGGMEALEHACELLSAACTPRVRRALPAPVRQAMDASGFADVVPPVRADAAPASGAAASSSSPGSGSSSTAMVPAGASSSASIASSTAEGHGLVPVPTPAAGVQVVLAVCRGVNAILGRYAHDGVSLTSDAMESALHLAMELARMEGTRPAFATALPSATMGGQDEAVELPAAVTLWNLATFTDLPGQGPKESSSSASDAQSQTAGRNRVQATALQIISNACHGVHGAQLVVSLADQSKVPDALPTLLRLAVHGTLKGASPAAAPTKSGGRPDLSIPSSGIASMDSKATQHVSWLLTGTAPDDAPKRSAADRSAALLAMGFRQTACGVVSRLAPALQRSDLQTAGTMQTCLQAIDWHAKALARALRIGKAGEATPKATHAVADKLWGIMSAFAKTLGHATSDAAGRSVLVAKAGSPIIGRAVSVASRWMVASTQPAEVLKRDGGRPVHSLVLSSGNLVKVVINLTQADVDAAECAGLLAQHAVDRILDLVKYAGPGQVRNNGAIALARMAARHAPSKARLKELGGTKVLLQLQRELPK